MASYSANTTFKISANVNQTVGTTALNTVRSYTVPANCYLDCSLIGDGSTSGSITVGPTDTGAVPTVITFSANAAAGVNIVQLKLGPGSIVSGTGGTSSTKRTVMLVGTLFENTP